MDALVTGGAGFIGRPLVEAPPQPGARVSVLDTAQAAGWPAGVDCRQGSVLDAALLADSLLGVEQVFHLAAIPHLWIRDKRRYGTVNVGGTEAVLQAAGAAGVRRLVHCSTEAVLAGTADASGCVDGSRDPRLDDMPGPYSRSKLLAEQAVLAAAARGLPAVVVSPTAPVGPGDASLTPPTQMLLDFLNGRHPAYLDCLLNLADVRDVARGHLLAAARGTPGRRYLLAGRDLRLSELLHELQRLTGLPMATRRIPWWLAWSAAAVGEFVADRITGRPPAATLNGVRLVRRPLRYRADIAERELGWRCRPLAESLSDAIEDLRRRGLLTRQPQLPPAPAAG